MFDIFSNLFDLIFSPIINFINDILVANSVNGLQLKDYTFKLGFGSIEWFSIDFQSLVTLIGGLLISIVFIILIFKVFKFFTKLVNSAFGGRKW